MSNARVTKMVYLADWKSAIEWGEQITNITWRFEHFGPFVHDVRDLVADDPDFEIMPTRNMYGAHKELLSTSKEIHKFPSLSGEDQKILDFVIATSCELNWSEFIRLVYSTYPVFSQERYSKLDLTSLAKEYEEVKPLLDAKN